MNDSCVWVSGGSNILLGDLLVIGGTVFFALSNVGQVGQCASTSFSKSLSLKYRITKVTWTSYLWMAQFGLFYL